MTSLLGRLRLALSPAARIADAEWQVALARNRLLAALDSDQRTHLRALTEKFLRRKRYYAAADLELSHQGQIDIAVMACLPVLHLGFDWLRGWTEVIVYPGEFRVRRHFHDEDTGVVSEGDDILSGEAWENGPLVLSWADFETDLEHPYDGFNLVIHEIAHKLDMLDGAADGMPPLPDATSCRAWRGAMQAAYDKLERQEHAGADCDLDPYALEGPDEFFAVISEQYFSAPEVLRAAFPDAYTVLQGFYRHRQGANLAV